MKHYSLNFEELTKASRALYEKAKELRSIDTDESGRYIIPTSLSPCNLAAFLDEIRGIVDAADPDTMLVEDEEGSLIRTTDKYFEP